MHVPQLFVRMTGPLDDFADDAERRARTIRQGRIARESLVGQVRIVFDLTGGLDDVDAAAAVADREFGAPGRGFERRAEVHELRVAALAVVRRAPRFDEIADLQVRLRA